MEYWYIDKNNMLIKIEASITNTDSNCERICE